MGSSGGRLRGFPEALEAAYEPIERLGRGAFGDVFRARRRSGGAAVAIKILKARRAPDVLDRFEREVGFLRRVEDPAIPRVLDAGVLDCGPYLVTELVEGSPLLDLPVGADPLPPLLDVAGALEAVHAAGVVHRDVKPSNILVTPAGRGVLIDFGLAYDPDLTPITATGASVGTVGYLAPEFLVSPHPTPATDWYAWGVSLYVMCEPQGLGFLRTVTLSSLQEGRRPALPFRLLGEDTPRVRLIQAMTATSPTARLTSRAAIEAYLRGAPAGRGAPPSRPSTPASPAPPTAPAATSRRGRAAAGAACLALVTVALALLVSGDDGEAGVDSTSPRLRAPELEWALDTGGERQTSLQLSEDGSVLVVATGPRVAYWDMASGERQLESELVGAPDRSWIAPRLASVVAQAPGGPLVAHATSTGSRLGELEESRGAILGVRFSADGQWVGAWASDGWLRVWSMRRPFDLRLALPGQGEEELAFLPTRDAVAVARADGRVEVHGLGPAGGVDTHRLPHTWRAMDASPVEPVVLGRASREWLDLLDLAVGRARRVFLPQPEGDWMVRFLADGRLLLPSGGSRLGVFRLGEKDPDFSLELGAGEARAVASAGSRLAVGTGGPQVQVWRLPEG